MSFALRKILVLLPVVLLGLLYVYDHAYLYEHVSRKRLFVALLSFLLLYSWILSEVLARRQRTYLQIGLQASFFIYVFMVLTLTGYFILFRELAGDWWAI